MDIINLKGEWQDSLTYTQTEPSTEGDQLPDVIKTIDCGLCGVSERLEGPESSQEVVGLKTRLMSFCAVHAFLDSMCQTYLCAGIDISAPCKPLFSDTQICYVRVPLEHLRATRISGGRWLRILHPHV